MFLQDFLELWNVTVKLSFQISIRREEVPEGHGKQPPGKITEPPCPASPHAKLLDLAFSSFLENALLFNLWIRINFLPTSREGEIPSLDGSFRQTLWACQLPQFTFPLALASKNASRTAGSQSIFFWKPFSKSGPFLTPAAPGSSQGCSAFAHGKNTAGSSPSWDPPGRGKSVTSSLPSDPIAFPRTPSFVLTPLLHDNLQEVTDRSFSVTNWSWARPRGDQSAGRGAQDTEPGNVQLRQKIIITVGGAAGGAEVAVAVLASSAC